MNRNLVQIKGFVNMKIKDLVNKKLIPEVDDKTDLELEDEDLVAHIKSGNKSINVNIKYETAHNRGAKNSLEALGYSFEVGV